MEKRPKCGTVLPKLMKILPERLRLQICQCLMGKFERRQIKQAFKIAFGTVRTRK